MLILSLIQGFFMVIKGIINLFPNFSISPEIISGISGVAEIFGYLNSFIHLNLVVSCIVAIFAVSNSAFLVRAGRTIWDLLPFT